MAIMFLSLGALVMFGTGETLAGKADQFAAQFVEMYVAALGGWSRPIVITAAFITMYSTTLTVLDGYPRVLSAGCQAAWPGTTRLGRPLYWVFVVVMSAGALLVFGCLTSHMRVLVDATTTVAFLSAPVFAFLNVRAVAVARLVGDAAPPRWLSGLAWLGLAFLTCFSIVFLVIYFGPGHS
jgi:Mn2+/Fe2+ NRAMP family transporter